MGATTGGLGGYWIGREGGLPFLTRHGRHIGITKERIAKARAFFTEHGPKAVFAARFIAIVRIFAGLLAGVTRMRFWVFFFWNALGALVWSVLFGALGYAFGNNLPRLEHLVGRTGLILFGVVVVAGVLVWHFRRSKSTRKPTRQVAVAPPPSLAVECCAPHMRSFSRSGPSLHIATARLAAPARDASRAYRGTSERDGPRGAPMHVIAMLRGRTGRLLLALVIANLAAWAWALTAFHAYPVLLGTALLAYGFGVRHAVDADHIAAIDNVTRKLMQDGKRPARRRLLLLARPLHRRGARLDGHRRDGDCASRGSSRRSMRSASMIGTIVSALFLLVIAIMNVFVLVSVYRTFQRVAPAGDTSKRISNVLLSGGGLLARIFRPLFGMIRESWHMYPLGFLFGLGFDTATEIGVLGISAAGGVEGPVGLVDPGVPGPVHRRHVAGRHDRQHADAARVRLGLRQADPEAVLQHDDHVGLGDRRAAGGRDRGVGPDRRAAACDGRILECHRRAERNFGSLGYLIIAVFAATWIIAAAIYRLKKYDTLEVSET